MIFCEQCGKQLNDNAKFCGKCGTPVGAVQEEAPEAEEQDIVPAACAQCGTPLEEGEAFCANCGAPVNAMPQQYQQAAVQAEWRWQQAERRWQEWCQRLVVEGFIKRSPRLMIGNISDDYFDGNLFLYKDRLEWKGIRSLWSGGDGGIILPEDMYEWMEFIIPLNIISSAKKPSK